MKKLATLICLCVWFTSAFSQMKGNEWIDYSSTYFKFKVADDGLYRISQQTLLDAGIPVGSIDPKNIQVFHQGVEQSLYIEGEADGSFDADDFIELFCKHNDGELDEVLYRKASEQPHKFYSLYQDTSIYFITWKPGTKGKRYTLQSNQNFSGLTADPYFMHTSNLYFTNQWLNGIPFSDLGYLCEYTEGEGYMSRSILSSFHRYDVSTPQFNTNGPQATVDVLAFSEANPTWAGFDSKGNNNYFTFHVAKQGFDPDILDTAKNNGYKRIFWDDFPIEKKYISSITSFYFRSAAAAHGRHTISYISLTYPRNFNLSSTSSFIFDLEGTNSFVEFSNYSSAKSNPVVYNLTSEMRLSPSLIGQTLRFNKGSAQKAKICINDQSDIRTVSMLENVTFLNYDNLPKDINYLIISNTQLQSGAEDYQLYRNSLAGGSYNVALAYADQLYDEFYYGVFHPMALRNFIYFMKERQSAEIGHLLLLGKGQNYTLSRNDQNIRVNGDLVPTMGAYPPSDYLFVTKLDASNMVPDIAIGRVPASSNTEVRVYLNKLKEFELNPITTKRVLHLAGGTDSGQNASFVNLLNKYGNIIRGDSFGGNTLLFSKESSIAIDESMVDNIIQEINSGVNFINYFGHGATDVTEVDLGEVQHYGNKGKYPVFFFDGCLIGNSFDQTSKLENFLLTPDKGAIGWIAGTFYSNVSELDQYTTYFHLNCFRENYGSTIGQILKETLKDYQRPGNLSNTLNARTMCYHGDPALRLYAPKKADYTVDAAKINFEIGTTSSDSFKIRLPFINKGKVTRDTVEYIVTVRNEGKLLYSDTTYVPPFVSAYNVSKNVPITSYIRGINTVLVEIDPNNKIEELTMGGEMNNLVSKDIFVRDQSTDILVPSLDDIVSDSELTVKFSNYLVPTSPQEYDVALDTSPKFNSSYALKKTIFNSKVLGEVTFSLPPLDSTDFYIQLINKTSKDTTVTSFAYIHSSPSGKSEGNGYKFKAATAQNISYSSNNRFEFNRAASNNIVIPASGTVVEHAVGTQYGIPIYFQVLDHDPGVLVLPINPDNDERYCEQKNSHNMISPNPWWQTNTGYPYFDKDSLSCYYYYNTTLKDERDSLVAFLNRIPKNYHLAFSNETVTGIEDWEEDLFVALEQYGASRIRTLQEKHPYILWGQKGQAKGTGTEIMYDPDAAYSPEQQIITLSTIIYPLVTEGSIRTKTFGPAQSWGTASVSAHADDIGDSATLVIHVIDKANISTKYTQARYTEHIDLSGIDANVYPRVALEIRTIDRNKRTPIQPYRWTVTFEPYPEGFAYMAHVNNDTIKEGDSYQIQSVYRNISKVKMDSLIVQVQQFHPSGTFGRQLDTLAALNPNDSVVMTRNYQNVVDLGDNIFLTTYNPNLAQKELSLSNNILENKLHVLSNNNLPILDVYFDNQQILNGQVINPSAELTIVGRSNHPYKLIDLTNLHFLAFTKEDGSFGDTILDYSNSPMVNFTEETAKQPSRLVYNFDQLAPGRYVLTTRLKAPTNNEDAKFSEYQIVFEISAVNEITQLLPYPNPMVNQCRFAYNFGGRSIPERYHLSIYNINGRLVREVRSQDFGPIRFGAQLSEFVFDGKDDFGDQLANGVYLYRFEILDAEHKESEIDQYFNNGFGKLYISR